MKRSGPLKRAQPLQPGPPPATAPDTAPDAEQPKKRHKYGTAPKDERTTKWGVLYDSKLEMRYAAQLELLRHAIRADERVTNIERQLSVPLIVEGCLICHYRADFRVTYADGRVELHEVKGLDTPEWRIKEKLWRALNKGSTLKVVRKVR